MTGLQQTDMSMGTRHHDRAARPAAARTPGRAAGFVVLLLIVALVALAAVLALAAGGDAADTPRVDDGPPPAEAPAGP